MSADAGSRAQDMKLEGVQPHRLMLLWNGAKFILPHDAIE